MKELFRFLRTLYSTNRKWFFIAVLFVAGFLLVSCSSSSGSAPPSGPIGGGCG